MTTTTTPTTDRVGRIIAEQFGIAQSEVKPDTAFVGDLNGDSLDRVEVVMRLEDEFGIVIDDDDAVKCHTVGDFVALVERELGR